MDNKVLARVAGREITSQYISEVISRYPAQQQAMIDNEQGRRNILEQAIAFELMYELGKEKGMDTSAEYVEQVNKIAKELLAQIVMKKTLDEVTILDEEVLKYYNENQEAFKEPANVTAKHILIDSEELAKEIKEKIALNELTFEEAAAKYSSCPSKEQGGNLGSFSKGMMVPEFEEVAFVLPIGEVSEPVKTQFGYHLIKVVDKKEDSIKVFEEVKDEALKQLLGQRQEQKYLDLIKELKNKYTVEIL